MVDECCMIMLLLKRLRAGQTVGWRSNEQFPEPLSVALGRLHAQLLPVLNVFLTSQAPTMFQNICERRWLPGLQHMQRLVHRNIPLQMGRQHGDNSLRKAA